MDAQPTAGSVLWLEQVLADDEDACPPLAGTVYTDVCVVGGGYTGLWTAIEIRRRHPDLQVTLIEATGCGFEASGRNGGWVTSWYRKLDHLIHRFGVQEGLWLAEQSSAAITHLREFTAEHGIDCGFRQAGALWAALTPAQLDGWAAAMAACQKHDRGELLEPVSGQQAQQRTGCPSILAAARHTDAAAVHPAQLVRGLRRAALRFGVRIFEGSPMVGLRRTRPAEVQTSAGSVVADQVVLGLNAWSWQVRELRRAYATVGSHMVATEPLGERISRYAWSSGELLGDGQLSVHYSQVTPDGRITLGRGLGAIGTGNRVSARHYRNPAVTTALIADLRRWFPQFADVAVTHAWGGAVDRAPGQFPFVGSLGPQGNVHYGLGYSGHGLAQSVLLARVLASCVTGADDAYARCGLAQGVPDYLPPEPLRSAGGNVVKQLVQRGEGRETLGNGPDRLATLGRHLVAARMPRWLEPRASK